MLFLGGSDVTKTIEKDEGICLEKSRVHLNGPGHRATMDIVPERRSDVAPGRSMPEMEINITEVIAVLGVKVMAADMPPFMQLHAFQCAKRSFDSLDKFSSRQLAHDVKKVNCVQL
jgi:dynein light chain LC8-type